MAYKCGMILQVGSHELGLDSCCAFWGLDNHGRGLCLWLEQCLGGETAAGGVNRKVTRKTLQGWAPSRSLTPINGRKYMGNWGYFTPISGATSLLITSRGPPCINPVGGRGHPIHVSKRSPALPEKNLGSVNGESFVWVYSLRIVPYGKSPWKRRHLGEDFVDWTKACHRNSGWLSCFLGVIFYGLDPVGFITMKKYAIWETIFGSLFPSIFCNPMNCHWGWFWFARDPITTWSGHFLKTPTKSTALPGGRPTIVIKGVTCHP